MGALPAKGQWVKLAVPASQVGLEGRTVNGMAFTLYGGRATWDVAGRTAGTAAPSPTTTTLASSANPALTGAAVTFTRDGERLGADRHGELQGRRHGALRLQRGGPHRIRQRAHRVVHHQQPRRRHAQHGGELWRRRGEQRVRQQYAVAGDQQCATAPPPPPTAGAWLDDAVPAGATLAGDSEGWSWVTNPAPFSGGLAHQSAHGGGHAPALFLQRHGDDGRACGRHAVCLRLSRSGQSADRGDAAVERRQGT